MYGFARLLPGLIPCKSTSKAGILKIPNSPPYITGDEMRCMPSVVFPHYVMQLKLIENSNLWSQLRSERAQLSCNSCEHDAPSLVTPSGSRTHVTQRMLTLSLERTSRMRLL